MNISLGLLFILIFYIDRFFGGKFNKGEYKDLTEFMNWSDSKGGKVVRWGGILSVLLLITVAIFVYIQNDINLYKWFWVFFYIITYGFKSLGEWMYLEGRKYLFSLSLMMLGIISALAIFHFNAN
jgi:hypothetical protein